MDHRLHERLPADIEARVTNLAHPEQTGTCWVLDASKSGVALLTRMPMSNGDTLKLQISGGEMFGHVVYVQPEDGLYRAGIEVEQVLLGRSDLARLVEMLGQEAVPAHENAARPE